MDFKGLLGTVVGSPVKGVLAGIVFVCGTSHGQSRVLDKSKRITTGLR
jgi:hypothetical protein